MPAFLTFVRVRGQACFRTRSCAPNRLDLLLCELSAALSFSSQRMPHPSHKLLEKMLLHQCLSVCAGADLPFRLVRSSAKRRRSVAAVQQKHPLIAVRGMGDRHEGALSRSAATAFRRFLFSRPDAFLFVVAAVGRGATSIRLGTAFFFESPLDAISLRLANIWPERAVLPLKKLSARGGAAAARIGSAVGDVDFAPRLMTRQAERDVGQCCAKDTTAVHG